MDRKEKIKELSTIIQDYRKGELDFSLGTEHVEKWLSQFSPDSRDIILCETVHIFTEWFISNACVDNWIDKIVPALQKKYGFDSLQTVFESVVFLNVQNEGKSQRVMLSRFMDRVRDQYGVSIKTQISNDISCYVYIDDGLYTGSRARRDLAECISCLPPQSSLEVFYIVACQSAFQYVKTQLEAVAANHKIRVSIHRYKVIWNDKTITWNSDGSGQSWNLHYNCLWPAPSLKTNEDVVAYLQRLQSMGENYEKSPFRKLEWIDDAGPFSSVRNRNAVEKEFLLQGIRIINTISESKGIYPLGYNLWPSFGLGTFCAFEMNISNTAPLVLWWGNNKEDGNCLDNWYPLLPRRVNAISEAKQPTGRTEYWGEGNPMNQYNMCPDCGDYFNHETDGGNGFCINCAWKH